MNTTLTWPSEVIQARRRAVEAAEASAAAIAATRGGYPAAPQQPEMHLQLLQNLECEIWHHRNARTGWVAEMNLRKELEHQLQQQVWMVIQWEKAYRDLRDSLNEHRAKHARGLQELDKYVEELAQARQGSAQM